MQTISTGPSLVQWNPNNRRQIDEAKKLYIESRKQFRTILDLNDQPIQTFKSDMGAFKIKEVDIPEGQIHVWLVNETGDERIMWDTRDPGQIKEAAERFQKYLDRGWKAYSIKRDGSRGPRIHAFKPASEEVIFDGTTTKQRLSEFAKSFTRIQVVPRTFPG